MTVCVPKNAYRTSVSCNARHRISAAILAMAAFSLLSFLQTSPLQAQGFGDPVEGRKIAAANCSSCHEMGLRMSDPDAGSVPSFRAIAAMPSTTMIAINVFLRTSHDVMPNLRLTDPQITDIGAYILSLRAPRQVDQTAFSRVGNVFRKVDKCPS